MPSINNFFGAGAKQQDGKILYQENLAHGLKLIITQQYRYDGNSCVVFEAGICEEPLHQSSNGISYYFDAYELCCNNEEYINHLANSSNNIIYYPKYKFEGNPKSSKFKSSSGIEIERHIENRHEFMYGTQKILTWKYVWRCEIGQEVMLKLISRKS